MQRRVFLLLGLILAMPALANAASLSLLNGPIVELQENMAGQTVTVMLSSGGDFYTDSNAQFIINGGVGPAPAIEAIFNDMGGSIPFGNLAGSIWANGQAGIGLPPEGTALDSSGRTVALSITTQGFTPQNISGIYAVLTVTTVGASPGDYSFTWGTTDLLLSDVETGDVEFVNLDLAPFILRVVPEPSSIVMGLFAAAGLAAVVIRRRRNA